MRRVPAYETQPPQRRPTAPGPIESAAQYLFARTLVPTRPKLNQNKHLSFFVAFLLLAVAIVAFRQL